jgi:Flp pilus assembly protein TadG
MNWISNLRRRLFREERAVAMVEFALVAPILFAVLFGVLDFGRAINYWNAETQMAAQGARLAAVNGDNTYSGTCVDSTSASTLADYIQCQADTNELRNGTGGTFGATAAQVCITPAGDGTGSVGQPITVTVKTNYTWIPIPGIGSIQIKTTATMRTERKWTAGAIGSTGATCP